MGKNNDKYTVSEYCFANKADYDRAMKEKETIAYIVANTDMADMKAVLKVYNRSVEKKSFQTVIGLEFVKNMRKTLAASGIIPEDMIPAIPVPGSRDGIQKPVDSAGALDKAEKYKRAYENALAGRTIKNIIIAFLIIIIAAMIYITYKSQYSVFTYFTDYKTNMENEILDKYEDWQSELDAREKELDEREKKSGIK